MLGIAIKANSAGEANLFELSLAVLFINDRLTVRDILFITDKGKCHVFTT